MLMNKIMGALLAVALVILALPTLSDIVFGKGGHHGGHHEEDKSVNERLAENFSYYVEMADSAGPATEEAVFDLGAELAAADVESGAKSFKAKCSSCHTVDAGGANGTGPNLHDVVGRATSSHAGFGYSGAMQAHAAERPVWDYAHLNEFIENPKGTVSGTAMSFAGLRKDPERMNVIAYLASLNAAAPAFPAPLPEEAVVETETGEGVETDVTDASEQVGDAVAGAVDATAEAAGAATDAVTEGAQNLVDQAKALVEDGADAADDAADKVKETVSGPHGPNNH